MEIIEENKRRIEVNRGEAFGFLVPNGAGKPKTMRQLMVSSGILVI